MPLLTQRGPSLLCLQLRDVHDVRMLASRSIDTTLCCRYCFGLPFFPAPIRRLPSNFAFCIRHQNLCFAVMVHCTDWVLAHQRALGRTSPLDAATRAPPQHPRRGSFYSAPLHFIGSKGMVPNVRDVPRHRILRANPGIQRPQRPHMVRRDTARLGRDVSDALCRGSRRALVHTDLMPWYYNPS